MTASFEYVFPTIRGTQAGREYYVSMCPLKLIPKIFLFDEEELKPELRAQRLLNKDRIPALARYLVENKRDYVFSSITASIDGDVKFVPVGEERDASLVGSLRVDMQSHFIINDGQHRRAAIEEALKQNPALGEETLSVVFFVDRGLSRCQQMFADLNRYAVKTSSSLGLCYDHRDAYAQISRLVAMKSKTFSGLVDMEKSALSARSRKLFTLSAIHSANIAILNGIELKYGEKKGGMEIDKAAVICMDFWEAIATNISEWGLAQQSKITAGDIREEFIHSHAVVLQALGNVCNRMVDLPKNEQEIKMQGLKKIDWRRTNSKVWEGRCMSGGRITKAGHHVTLTANYVKNQLGLSLSPEEQRTEEAFKRGEYVK